MKQQPKVITPEDRITILLRSMDRLEQASELAERLDKILPSDDRMGHDLNSEIKEVYFSVGLLPVEKILDERRKEISYPALDEAKREIFKRQKMYLRYSLLQELGFVAKSPFEVPTQVEDNVL